MLAENIKNLRKKNGLTQEGLARKADLTYHSIIKIEQGTNKEPRLNTLIKLADAFDVSMDDLVGRKRKSHTKGQSGKPKV